MSQSQNEVATPLTEADFAEYRAWGKRFSRQVRSWKREQAVLLVTPSWANKKAIGKFYAEARRLTKETGIAHEVDHVVPIRGERMCGLHVEHNLQVIPKAGNNSKRSHFSDWEKASRIRTDTRMVSIKLEEIINIELREKIAEYRRLMAK